MSGAGRIGGGVRDAQGRIKGLTGLGDRIREHGWFSAGYLALGAGVALGVGAWTLQQKGTKVPTEADKDQAQQHPEGPTMATAPKVTAHSGEAYNHSEVVKPLIPSRTQGP